MALLHSCVVTLLVLTWIFLPVCISEQTWLEGSNFTEANPGENATLPCKIFNETGICIWKKDDKIVNDFTGRIKWLDGRSSRDCTLIISDVKFIDAGNWECYVADSSTHIHDSLKSLIATVVLIVAPELPELESNGYSKDLKRSNFSVEEGVVEEIKCNSRIGNPPAVIKWFFGPSELVPSSSLDTNELATVEPKTWRLSSTLRKSFYRKDNGRVLKCIVSLQNDTFRNRSIATYINVLYPPENIKVEHTEGNDVALHSNLSMHCTAEAKPKSRYQWFQVTSSGKKIQVGAKSLLFIKNIGYVNDGRYQCLAYNVINRARREIMSEYVQISIVGAPQIMSTSERDKVTNIRLGLDAVLFATFCSNPKPSGVVWQWDSFALNHGQGHRRYIAEKLFQIPRTNCYVTKLLIQSVVSSDAGRYHLTVTNYRGKIHTQVTLIVNEPVTMMVIIAVIMIFFITLALTTIVIFYSFKSEKCCFPRLLLSSFPDYIPSKGNFNLPSKDLPFVNLWLQKCSFSNLDLKSYYLDTSSLESSRITL